MQIAPSTYYRCKSLEAQPEQRCQRYHRDKALKPEIMRVWQENKQCYGARKVWKQMQREGFTVARCTVARLMKVLGIKGIRRGRRCIPTIPDDSAAKPLDLVNREFTAQRANQLWVADITYVATWSSFVYVAFVIDVFSRKIVGLRVMKSMQTHRFVTRNVYLKRDLQPRLVVSVITMTTPWPKPSMDLTKLKSSTKMAPGKGWNKLSLPPWIGLTGLTIRDCYNLSETFHPLNMRKTIIDN